MAKSKDTFSKKDKEQRRLKQKKDKQEKMQERKLNAKKGKSLEDMMAYIDENGNISNTRPDPRNKKIFNVEDIQIKVLPPEKDDPVRSGTLQFFDDEKGFGFIYDHKANEKIFVHISNLTEPLKISDKVSFETEFGNRGPIAVNVRKTS